jgi:hypothetical protein
MGSRQVEGRRCYHTLQSWRGEQRVDTVCYGPLTSSMRRPMVMPSCRGSPALLRRF